MKNIKKFIVLSCLISIIFSGVAFTPLNTHAQISSVTILVVPIPIIDSVTYSCEGSYPIQVHVSNQISNCVYSIMSTIPVTSQYQSNNTGIFTGIQGITDAVFRVHNGSCYTDTAVHFDCNGQVLPMKLIDFNVKLVHKEAILNWKVENNDLIDKFEIEESFNGRTFNYLKTINAYYNTGEAEYVSSDQTMFQGYNYYRLKIFGKDGSVQYSPIRFAIFNNEIDFVWYPNPTSRYIYIEYFNEYKAKEIKLNSYNIISGQSQEYKKIDLIPGHNKIAIDVSSLSDGSYILKYEIGNNDKVGNIRFQKITN